jgi:hypothetical protein
MTTQRRCRSSDYTTVLIYGDNHGAYRFELAGVVKLSEKLFNSKKISRTKTWCGPLDNTMLTMVGDKSTSARY